MKEIKIDNNDCEQNIIIKIKSFMNDMIEDINRHNNSDIKLFFKDFVIHKYDCKCVYAFSCKVSSKIFRGRVLIIEDSGKTKTCSDLINSIKNSIISKMTESNTSKGVVFSDF